MSFNLLICGEIIVKIYTNCLTLFDFRFIFVSDCIYCNELSKSNKEIKKMFTGTDNIPVLCEFPPEYIKLEKGKNKNILTS